MVLKGGSRSASGTFPERVFRRSAFEINSVRKGGMLWFQRLSDEMGEAEGAVFFLADFPLLNTARQRPDRMNPETLGVL